MTTRTYRAGNRKRPLCRPFGDHGFTLIELVVVMLIMAVATAMVMPAVRAGNRQRELRRTVQHFVRAVRTASSRAIVERRRVELSVWPEAGSFAVEGMEKAQRLPDFASFGEIVGGRAVGRDLLVFDFYPLGSSSGGSVELDFELSHHQSYVFKIDPLVSSVAVEEGS